MGRMSRVAFYVGWAGVAIIVAFVLLLLFRWMDVPSLAVILPFAAGFGALELSRRGSGHADLVALATDVDARGLIGRSVSRLYRRLLKRRDDKVALPRQPARIDGADLDPAEWVARRIRQLKTGRMEVDAPKTGRVGSEARVVVAIAQAEHERIIASVAEGRQIEVVAIKVDTFMRVELRGDAFDITSPPNPNKIVPDDQAVTWEFAIVPKKSGRQLLTVHAIVRLHVPAGGEEYYELEPQPYPVIVSISVSQAIKQWLGTPYVKFALAAWTTLAATFGALYAIEPIKEKINDWLKPYVAWVIGLFS